MKLNGCFLLLRFGITALAPRLPSCSRSSALSFALSPSICFGGFAFRTRRYIPGPHMSLAVRSMLSGAISGRGQDELRDISSRFCQSSDFVGMWEISVRIYAYLEMDHLKGRRCDVVALMASVVTAEGRSDYLKGWLRWFLSFCPAQHFGGSESIFGGSGDANGRWSLGGFLSWNSLRA